MKEKMFKRIGAFLLATVMVFSVLPGNLLTVKAASVKWEHLSEGEKNAGTASYDAASDTITFVNDYSWSGRMKYNEIDDVTGKDYVVEFDTEGTSGMLGVYSVEDSGNIYGVYLDTAAAVLDELQVQGWVNVVDHFAFAETEKHPTVAASNWSAADNTKAHLRVEFICGEGGALAGGTVNYYKKDSATGEYLKMGSISVPSTIADDANYANKFGVQMFFGSGKISNITVKELKDSPIKESQWKHMSDAEKTSGGAVYNVDKDAITFTTTYSWADRMKYIGIEDVSGKDYAVEFDVTNISGLIGVYNFEDTGNLYGVYLDAGACKLDALYTTDWATIQDSFEFLGTGTGYTAIENWTAADNAKASLRVEFIRGEDGSLAGGKVNYYKKDSATSEYLLMGSVAIAGNIADNANLTNKFGIQMFCGSGTVSNITFKELESKEPEEPENPQEPEDPEEPERPNLWAHMSDAEKANGGASYDVNKDTLTFKTTYSWADRMKYIGIEDVSGKDYVIEFDATNISGLLGVYNFEDTGNLYGVYLDAGAGKLDALYATDWVAVTDNFEFLAAGTGYTPIENWTVADNAKAHYKVEFICGNGGSLAGGTVNYYKQDSVTSEYLLMGSVAIPKTVTDDANLANKFGIQMFCGSGTISNITIQVAELETNENPPTQPEVPGLWRHMSVAEKQLGTATYDEKKDTITYKIDAGWSSRMYYAGLEAEKGKNYSIEFDVNIKQGLVGVYNYESSGNMYGVYLDTAATLLDEVHFTDWGTCVDHFSFFETTYDYKVHATTPAQNWDASKDVGTTQHMRVDFICKKGGSLAGGTVNYYKQNPKTGKYLLIGSVKIPTTVEDDENLANYFGIQFWLGEGTVSNMKISELSNNENENVKVEVEKLPTWVHISEAEKEEKDAIYYEKSDTIKFSGKVGWTSRLLNTEIEDISGENFAVEFDANLGDKGVIGISPFYEDAANFYGAYFDIAGSALDGFGAMGYNKKQELNIIDEFHWTDDSIYPHFAIMNTSPTKGDDIRMRIECFLGEDGTMAGGTVHFYFKMKGFDEWKWLGIIKLPGTIVDREGVANRILVHSMATDGTISNISIIRDIKETILPYNASKSTKWGYATDKEELISAAMYNDKTGEMTIGCDTGWNSRMSYLEVPDVTDTAFAMEFNAKFNSSGILGVIPFYEDEDNWYGVYLDRGSQRIDGAGYIDGKIVDDFDYVDATYYSSVQNLKTPIINEVRIRFEYFPNGEDGASGAICKMYFKQMPGGKILDDRWRLIGEFTIPETVVDRAGEANKIMISSRAICAVLSDISYTEIDPDTQTEYYNGPEDLGFEDGYPEDDYQPVASKIVTRISWWSIALMVVGGGSLLVLILWGIIIATRKKKQKNEQILNE